MFSCWSHKHQQPIKHCRIGLFVELHGFTPSRSSDNIIAKRLWRHFPTRYQLISAKFDCDKGSLQYCLYNVHVPLYLHNHWSIWTLEIAMYWYLEIFKLTLSPHVYRYMCTDMTNSHMNLSNYLTPVCVSRRVSCEMARHARGYDDVPMTEKLTDC